MRTKHPARILLVEDNSGDVKLTLEGFREVPLQPELFVVRDGIEALAYLRREDKWKDTRRPDLVLLDLNLPRKDGREVLREIKRDPSLATIPVIVVTTSNSEDDIRMCYELHANGYVRKPPDFDDWVNALKNIGKFWLETATLP